MQTLRFGRLLVAELATLLIVGWTITVTTILPKDVFHFHELVITTYANGAMDFSTDATGLVRGLGILSLLTLSLGLVSGTVMGLAAWSFAHSKEKRTVKYDEALASAGFVNIRPTQDGVAYELTEHGRQFLRDYAFLDREALTVREGIKE